MNIDITYKKIPSSASLKSYINGKFDKLDKLLDYPAGAKIVLAEEKLRSMAEINLTCDKLKVHAKGEAENNMYAAIDGIVEKVKIQIHKFKDKQRRHLAGDKQSIRNELPDDSLGD